MKMQDNLPLLALAASLLLGACNSATVSENAQGASNWVGQKFSTLNPLNRTPDIETPWIKTLEGDAHALSCSGLGDSDAQPVLTKRGVGLDPPLATVWGFWI